MKLKFGDRLKALRVARKLGVRELGREINISPMSVLNAENNKGMCVIHLIKFSKFFNVSTDLLLFGSKGKGSK